MPALSKKQQKFMGIVRSIQKGEQPASKFNKDAQDVAKDMKKKDVKDFASTKHKGLPMKKEILGKLKEMIKQELSEYTYGVGDVVKDDNPTCPHYGAQGKVKSVNPKSVVFVVTNKGDNFKPGQELEKSHDQMKKIGESAIQEQTVTPINKIKDIKNLVKKDLVSYRGTGAGGNFEISIRNKKVPGYPPSFALLQKDEKKYRDIRSKQFKIKPVAKYFIKGSDLNQLKKFGNVGFLATNRRESVDEAMNPSAVKKMRDEFEKTGQLPPHLKKFALDLKILKKKHKVKNIVVPGLEWMSDMKEQSVNEKKKMFPPKKMTPKQAKEYKKFIGYAKMGVEYQIDMSLFESINEARLDPKQLLQQLGGNRFIAMTGAKNLAIDKPKNELHMKIGRNAKGVSHVRIRLSSMDLYDMEFLQVRAGKIKIKSKEKGVYADQLGKMFKKNTGMNVRL